MTSHINRRMSEPTEVAVSTTRLRACGASSWTAASARANQDRWVEISNNSGSLVVNVHLLTPATTVATAVRIGQIAANGRDRFLVQAGDEIVLVRASSSSDTCTAYERVAR